MFRKLVSGLPFSPALVGQLGFYARRLKTEEATRRVGLIFTAMALIVQSFAVFSPIQPANASRSANDIVYGGVDSIAKVLAVYDDPSKDFKKIADFLGITRSELAAMTSSSINSKEYGTGSGAWVSFNRVQKRSAAEGEVMHNINGTIVYSRPLWIFDTTSWTIPHGSTYPAFRGTSATRGVFAIMKSCGNFAVTSLPTPPPPPPPVIKNITVCRPGTGVITIKETEKLPTDLPSDSEACKPAPQPFAACSLLSEPKKIERTKFSVTATTVVKNGATISSYTFVIKKNDANGAVVTTKTINSTATQLDNYIIEMTTPGTYFVKVTVKTSAGDVSSTGCEKSFTVLPPEKCQVNSNLLATDKECQPCPANPTLWYKSEDCSEKVAKSKEASNLTQNSKPASSVTASASDRIQYTLTVYNVGKVLASVDFKENMSDTLEYSTLYDNGGGTIAKENDSTYLSWGKVSLKPGEKVSRSFTVKVHDSIPLTARGLSDPTSFDCIMTNVFGNTVNINMNCQAPKVVERVVEQLPNTGPAENMLFSGIVGSIVIFFWARSRQLGTEVRLIRKDFNAGTI